MSVYRVLGFGVNRRKITEFAATLFKVSVSRLEAGATVWIPLCDHETIMRKINPGHHLNSMAPTASRWFHPR